MKIQDLTLEERPREKLRERGLMAMSNVELLAILIRSGARGKNAVDVARELFAMTDNRLCTLSSLSLDKVSSVGGVGFSKACQIVAAFELGRRCAAEMPVTMRGAIRDTRQACKLLQPRLRVLDHEECWALFLNRNNRPICKKMISSGGLCETTMDSRMVAEYALEKKATGVILFHNHPSGSPEPSRADLKMTSSLRNALASLDIVLFDHIIISGDSYYSCCDQVVTQL